MDHFAIKSTEKIGFLHVVITSATQIEFDILIPTHPNGYQQVVEKLCEIAPIMMRLDADLMEAYDDAFRTKPKQSDITKVQEFSKSFTFEDVYCALPGFEYL